MSTPIVEVVAPVRHSAEFVLEAVASILSQTRADFSLHIINDGADSAVERVLSKLTDSRIEISRTDSPQGAAKVMNVRMQSTPARYLAVMHADDIAHPQRLEKQITFLEQHPKVALVGTAVDLGGSWQGQRYFPSDNGEIRATLLFDSPFSHPTVCFSVELMRQYSLLYDENYVVNEDYELWTRIPPELHMANLDLPLLTYRVHSQQASQIKAQEVLEGADRIRRTQLIKTLALDPTSEELALHSQLARRAYTSSNDFLSSAHAWFIKLLDAVSAETPFSEDTLFRVTERLWWQLCLDSHRLGSTVVDCYLDSLFAQRARRSQMEIATLLRRCTS